MRISKLGFTLLAAASLSFGCGVNGGNGIGHGHGNGDGGTGNGSDASANTGDGGTGPNGCVGLACQQVQNCPGGGTTTLTGKVYAPNGTLPLYNAIVYVPNGPVDPFTPGVTCDRCNGHVSGNPLVSTLTDASGSFTLTNVPAGQNIPLVIQIGRWRRQVTIQQVPACASTTVDAGSTRMPKNSSEGDIPQMAIATGSSDPFECLLLKIGIDPAEITSPTAAKPGRVHFFTATDSPGTNMNPSAPSASTLYASLQNLLKYDIVILPCEGSAYDKDNGNQGPSSPTGLMVQYVNAGGRLFTTHYSYDWLSYGNSPFNAVGTWDLDQAYPPDGTVGTIDQTFAKGKAFASWLHDVDPTTNGSFPIVQPRHDIDAVSSTYAQQWVTSTGLTGNSTNGVMHFTFNTPLNAPKDDMGAPEYCGRVVFSDFHVSANALDSTQSTYFPGICKMSALTTQEKALAFMLFDLSSCVQQDSQPPIG